MFVVHGTYHWAPRRLAFRNDFCLTCDASVRAVQVRTFDVLHVFMVPVLPLGFWRSWFCTECGQQPSVHTRTRFGFKVVGLVLLVLWSLIGWLVPVQRGEEDTWWAMRIAAPIGAVATAVHLRRARRDDPIYAQQFQRVNPADDVLCPFCAISLVDLPSWSCPACGIQRK